MIPLRAKIEIILEVVIIVVILDIEEVITVIVLEIVEIEGIVVIENSSARSLRLLAVGAGTAPGGRSEEIFRAPSEKVAPELACCY